jgi:hypothetical protein
MFSLPRFVLIQLSLLLAFGLVSCGSLFGTRATPTPSGPTGTPVPPTATSEPSAATVNGESLTASELQSQVAEYKSAQTALGKTVSDQDATKTVLEDLIAQVLLAQGAKSGGFDLTDPALQS